MYENDNLDGDYASSYAPPPEPKKNKAVSASDGIDWLISAVTGIIVIIVGWVIVPVVGWRTDLAVDGILSGTSFDTTMWSTVSNPDMPTGAAFWTTVSSFIVAMAVFLFIAFFIKTLLGIKRGRNEL